jgi:hypothetical protein
MLAQAMIFLTCIEEVPGLTLGQDTVITGFSWFTLLPRPV